MLNNLIFLCGPHGSGKTTLGEEIKKTNPRVMIPELYSRNVKFNTNPEYRLSLKICQRSIENFEYLEIARKNPDKIVLGNRCIYDQYVYNKVYVAKGWLSEECFYKYNQISEISFVGELRNPYAIVLNPGFETVKKHLEKRWREKGKKWREDDLEYAKIACEEYEKLEHKNLIYYIDHEIDLNSETDVKPCSNWIEKITNKETVMV